VITETIKVGEDSHAIELKPVTVLFNAGQKEIEYPERISITPEMTMDQFRKIDKIDPYTACLFRIVVHDYSYPVTKKNIQKSVSAFQHLIGLFSLSLSLIAARKKVVWKYPEYCLHPKYQGNIADVMILMADPKFFTKFVCFVKKGYFDSFILSCEDPGETIIAEIYSTKESFEKLL
jgi:hypothetical protein